MNGWFIAIIILGVLNVGINLAKHGQNKNDEKYNFWIAVFALLLNVWVVYNAILTGF